MDEGNPNPNKYFVCYNLSPISEFSSLGEALNYFSDTSFTFDLMIVVHKKKFYAFKKDEFNNDISINVLRI